jgi:glycogen operon protein
MCKRRLLLEAHPDEQGQSLSELLRTGHLSWHGVKHGQPDWSFQSHSLALCVEEPAQSVVVYLILNAYWEPLDFELPPMGNGGASWRRWIDTALLSPHDIGEWETAPLVSSPYRVSARSSVVLYTESVRSE